MFNLPMGFKPVKVQQELADERVLRKCAEQFGLVGDPTRMKICWLLCQHRELSVGEIADILGVSVSVVSHSLRRLREHEMVRTRREHKQVFYRLARASFGHVLREGVASLTV